MDGPPAGAGRERPASTPSLAEVYQGVRDGRERLDTPEGRWRFGLALLAESLAR